MLYGANVAICSEKKIQNYRATVWQNVKFFNVKPVGASQKQ